MIFKSIHRPLNLILKRAMSSEEQDVLFKTVENAGVITLNRPKALNALNHSMILKMFPKLKEWETTKSLVIIKGSGTKAFCAGGDIKACIDKVEGPKFFYDEYITNFTIGNYKIPYISLINGITMGGGLGVSVHGKYRVATENTMIAMPETKIGLFPDVGGTFFLPRLKQNLGYYLGLTGDRLKGKDVMMAGIATHYVPSQKIEELESELTKCLNVNDVDNVLNKYSEPMSDFSLAPNLKNIEECFSASTVEEIISRLEKINNPWSIKTIGVLNQMSPGSLKITLRALREGAKMDLGKCLETEYRLATWSTLHSDFSEGVRALLIEKDNSPKWNPKTLADVTDEYVNNFFKELPGKKELNLSKL